MTTLIISSGQAISGYQVQTGSQLDVLSGGLARYTTLLDLGDLVLFGGDAYHTMISSGGLEIVQSGGFVRGDIIQSGGSEFVENNSSSLNETIESGGLLASIDSIVQQTTIESGGELSIELDTAQVSYTHIELGGKIDLGFLPFSSGTTSATINTSSDQLTVTDGGASYTLQLAGGYNKGHFTVAKDHGGTVVFYRYGSVPSQDERDNHPTAAANTLPNAWTDLLAAAEIAQGGIGSEFNIEATVATSATPVGGGASAGHAAMPEIMVHNGGFVESLPQPS